MSEMHQVINCDTVYLDDNNIFVATRAMQIEMPANVEQLEANPGLQRIDLETYLRWMNLA